MAEIRNKEKMSRVGDEKDERFKACKKIIMGRRGAE